MTACYSVVFRLAPLPHGTPPTTYRHRALSTRSGLASASPATFAPPVQRDLAELPQRSPPPPELQWSPPREQPAPHPSPRSSKAKTPCTIRSWTDRGTAAQPYASYLNRQHPSRRQRKYRHSVRSSPFEYHSALSSPIREVDASRRIAGTARRRAAP